jgi:malonyl-CoA decarboxylase
VNDQSRGIINRALRRFSRAWRRSGKGRALKDGVAAHLPDQDAQLLRRKIDACLEARGGEVSARARAAELGETFLALDAEGRRRFLVILARDYGTDHGALETAIANRAQAKGPGSIRRADVELKNALVSPRVRLLSQFNGLDEGVKFLVDLRAELKALAKKRPYLRSLDGELRDLLESWFDVGFLNLRLITWETPASLLEKLIEYEAVHAIRSWSDLKNRLEADRRCYAFFHPHMPDEPLIFVEVALVNGMSDNVQQLLDVSAPAEDPDRADTAIFYSISNCQDGLAGISFGSFLIKRVADDLAHALPNIKTFATLSPIGGFRRWLDSQTAGDDGNFLTSAETQRLEPFSDAGSGTEALMELLSRPTWHRDEAVAEVLEPVLLRLCAVYLTTARRGARALDRVAHFHLSNGARIERINWLADTSERGLAQSAGMMVNYRYELERVEQNHEAYAGEGEVTVSSDVRKLLKS